MFSSDLSWPQHYQKITFRAYRQLSFIRRCFSALERVQWHATKYTLNDFSTNYRQRLILRLMYFLEFWDVFFLTLLFLSPPLNSNLRSFFGLSSLLTLIVQIHVCSIHLVCPYNKCSHLPINCEACYVNR